MTLQEIVDRVKEIKECSGDNETAHAKEDDLWEEVLAFISSGLCDNPVGYAAEALKTKKIEFTRWYA